MGECLMRALAALLLVVNLLVAVWVWTRPPEAIPTAPRVQASPLVMLSELPGTRRADESSPEPLQAAANGPVVNGCQAVGPFADRDAVIAARDTLLATGVQSLPRAVDASQRLGFWVHTQPADSRDAAVATIDRLRRAGIRDFYVVNDATIQNAVSLGVFGQRDAAEQHAARLRAMGFDVVVGERRRQMTAWWLEFDAPAPGSTEAAAVADLVLDGDTLMLEPRRCEP